ncbi:MAG: response regulator [Bacteroidota bacterium]
MTKTPLIMLVDDNKIDLFIHGEIIKKIPFNAVTISFNFAGDALTYLEENGEAAWPGVIMLDIHMPIMNGFDFLSKYEKLPEAYRKKCKVVMISSSLDNEDMKKAQTNKDVAAFLEKPLNAEKFVTLLSSFFDNALT